MDEKTTKNAKITESHTFTSQDILVKTCIYKAYTFNNSSTVVYGGDILSFHIFEALNDNLWSIIFSQA